MKPNWYQIICNAVENGSLFGINRYLKHRDEVISQPESLATEIEQAIMNELAEVIVFDDNYADSEFKP